MKKSYIKPIIRIIQLRPEEYFAGGSSFSIPSPEDFFLWLTRCPLPLEKMIKDKY